MRGASPAARRQQPHTYVPDAGSSPLKMYLTRLAWINSPTRLPLQANACTVGNRVGLFRSTMWKWGMAYAANCDCRAFEQTADHKHIAIVKHLNKHDPSTIF